MKILIVYYSLSGNTRTLATRLAEDVGADIEELRCNRYQRGFLSYLRAGYDSWKGETPTIEPLSHEPAQYDLVVVAGPIWTWRAAPPLRVWLTQERERLPRIAFLLTHGGSGAETSLRELEEIAGQAPVASLVVREADIKSQNFAEPLQKFSANLQIPKAA